MRQDGQGFAFVMLFLQSGQVFLPADVLRNNTAASEKAHLRCALPIFCLRCLAFPRGFPGAFHQAAIGDEILHPGEAVDIMDFVAQHEAEDLADAGHGLQQIQGVGVVVLGGCDEASSRSREELVIIGDERQVDFDTFLYRGIGKALGHALTVGLVGDLFADRGQSVLAVGILDMGQEVSPFMRQVACDVERSRVARIWAG